MKKKFYEKLFFPYFVNKLCDICAKYEGITPTPCNLCTLICKNLWNIDRKLVIFADSPVTGPLIIKAQISVWESNLESN